MAKTSDQSKEYSGAGRSITRDEYSIFDYPNDANTIFSLVFEYLIFFDFVVLEDVSKEFQELIEMHIKHKYLNVNKMELFKKFNLEHFLRNIDRKINMAKPKPITFKEFKFIIKFFSWEASVTVQTKYLSEHDQDVFRVLEEVIKSKKIKFINIDGEEYATEQIIIKSPVIDIQREMSLAEFESLISGDRVNRSFSLLTDYSEINRNKRNLKEYLEHLEHLEMGELYLKASVNASGASGSLNQCCDEILEALAVKNTYSLKRIKIESCYSYKLFTLLSKFKNINEVILDNINYIGPHLPSSIDLSMVRELITINCSFIDDWACYEMATNYFKKLESWNISNCENVTGSFIYKLNPSNALNIDLTNLNKEFKPKIYIKKIPKRIIYSECNYFPYVEEQICNVILSYEEIYNSEYRYSESITELMPHGFANVIERFYRSGLKFHLDLRHFNNLNENCLELIHKSASHVLILSLNTYYPHIPIERLHIFLNKITIRELRICGYKYADVTDERNCCDHVVNALLVRNTVELTKIDITDCIIGKAFPKAIQKFKKLHYMTLSNVRFFLPSVLEISLPKIKTIKMNNCPELNDEICSGLIQNCVKLRDFYFYRCNNVTGSFLLNLNINKDRWLYLKYAPKVFNFNLFKETLELPDTLDKIILYLRLVDRFDPCKIDDENEMCLRDAVSNASIFNDKLFTNLLKFRGISELTLSTFYPNINDWTNLCHLKLSSLYLFNNKFHENDATMDILNGFAELNSNCLKFLILKMCKINKHGIKSIACFKKLEYLSFETIRGLTNKLIQQIYVPSQSNCRLKIIDNDEFDDLSCLTIIQKAKVNIESVVNCRKITESLIESINSLENIILNNFNISGTDAGYYQLWNPLFFINPRKELLNFTHGTHVDYLKRIFGDTSIGSITKLPVSLIDCFSSQETLDLRDWYELDDVMFELISQLEKLGILKIRTNYLHVMDRRAISRNLAKMNLHTLILQGYDKLSNCDDILEPFSYITNHLQEIHLINCHPSKELSESLCHTNKFSVYRISNEKTILHR